jgi:hypothetical protein
MKTEKRHAKEGERILIVDARDTWDEYANGDVLEVTLISQDDDSFGGWVDEFSGSSPLFAGIAPDEYEVIVGEETEV